MGVFEYETVLLDILNVEHWAQLDVSQTSHPLL